MSRTIALFLVGLLAVLAYARAAEAVLNSNSQFTPTQLEGYCNEKGGTYSPPNKSGVYFCLLPDGTLIGCGGSVPGCTATKVGGPGSLNLRDIMGIVALSSSQIQEQIKDLETKVDEVVERQGQILQQEGDIGDSISRLELMCTTADLVPLPISGARPLRSSTFCLRDDQGRLHVTVYNQGGLDANASTTRIRFECGDTNECEAPIVSDAATEALTAFGGFIELVFEIPNACFDPATNLCSFEIFADAENVVPESNEPNNVTEGACGPQFF